MHCQQRNMRFTMSHIGNKAQLQAPWSNSHFLSHQDAKDAKSAVRKKTENGKTAKLVCSWLHSHGLESTSGALLSKKTGSFIIQCLLVSLQSVSHIADLSVSFIIGM